jgi:hypothetical protein
MALGVHEGRSVRVLEGAYRRTAHSEARSGLPESPDRCKLVEHEPFIRFISGAPLQPRPAGGGREDGP